MPRIEKNRSFGSAALRSGRQINIKLKLAPGLKFRVLLTLNMDNPETGTIARQLTEREIGAVFISGMTNIATPVIVGSAVPGPAQDSSKREKMLGKASQIEDRADQVESFARELSRKGAEELGALAAQYRGQATEIRDRAPDPNGLAAYGELIGAFWLAPAIVYAALKARAIRRARRNR
jgi:hypothetical protein